MYFLYCCNRNRLEVLSGIKTMIDCTDINIINIKQNSAAGCERRLGNKFPFGDSGMFILQIAGDVFDQEFVAEKVLDSANTLTNMLQRLFGVRQRQQII